MKRKESLHLLAATYQMLNIDTVSLDL